MADSPLNLTDALALKVAELERYQEALRALHTVIFARYCQTFPTIEFVDPITAVDLFSAEVLTQRKEIAELERRLGLLRAAAAHALENIQGLIDCRDIPSIAIRDELRSALSGEAQHPNTDDHASWREAKGE